jgi:hypothetical protein
MTTIDRQLLETLLSMSESTSLDFKNAQYPLENASDDQKGEFVKDVIAFANAWKTSDAYILIGVEENPGGRGRVLGISSHHDDAALQQLVNTKLNTPVDFAYVAVAIEGRNVGVVRIAREQQRPIYLKRRFGRLEPNNVYIRRGSSTDVAAPDEIARMGAASVGAAQQPLVQLELGNPEARERFGTTATLVSQVLSAPPKAPELPEAFAMKIDPPIAEAALRMKEMKEQIFGFRSPYQPSIEKLVGYRKEIALLVPLGFFVRNIGSVLVEDLRVLVELPKVDGLRVTDELPDKPRGPLDMPAISRIRDAYSQPRSTTIVHDRGVNWEVVARLGKIQPSASSWSMPFWIGCPNAHAFDITACMFADNISQRVSVSLRVSLEPQIGYLDEDDLKSDF